MEEEKRPQAINVALIVVGVAVAVLLLFAFLNRGSQNGSLTGRTWQLAAITGQTPAFQGVIPPAEQPLYTIAFAMDDTFVARADCNAVSGSVLARSHRWHHDHGRPEHARGLPGRFVRQPVRAWPHHRDDVGDHGIQPDPRHDRWWDGHLRGRRDRATRPVGDAVSEPDADGVPVAEPEPDADRESDTHAQPVTDTDRLPHPAGIDQAECGSDGHADPGPRRHQRRRPHPPRPRTDADTDSCTDAPPAGGDIIGTSWQLLSYTTRDPAAGGEVPAAERFKYTIAFAEGGTFSATADCNVLIGTWTATATGGLAIVPGPSSIVLCGEGSNSDLYILALTNSASYVIANNGLTITLEDGGTLVYEPAP